MARKKSFVTEGIPYTVAIISIFIWYLFSFLFSEQKSIRHRRRACCPCRIISPENLILDHIDPADMTLIVRKLCLQKCVHDIQCQAFSGNSCPQRQNVGVVMFSCGSCAECICAQRCPDAFDLIGSDGNADAWSADQNPLFHFVLQYTLSHCFRVYRVITIYL